MDKDSFMEIDWDKALGERDDRSTQYRFSEEDEMIDEDFEYGGDISSNRSSDQKFTDTDYK